MERVNSDFESSRVLCDEDRDVTVFMDGPPKLIGLALRSRLFTDGEPWKPSFVGQQLIVQNDVEQ